LNDSKPPVSGIVEVTIDKLHEDHVSHAANVGTYPTRPFDVGRRIDALVVRTIPSVHKAVKWNSPLYGVKGYGWFFGIHCFTKYVKVAFFRGASLRPIPPGDSKSSDTRYIDIREGDELDAAQMADWVKQAAELLGFLGPRS
jgi:hypothetical protein